MSASSHTLRGTLFVLTAAVLWGTLGPLMRVLQGGGLSAVEIGFYRAALGGVTLALLARQQGLSFPARRDYPFFALYGLVSVAAFFVLYALSVQYNPIAVAVVLLYTAPAFVVLFSWRLFGEAVSPVKGVALLLAFVGAALVAGAHEPRLLALNLPGLLTGLGSGLTYALFSIFGKFALRRHHPLSTMACALSFGALLLVPVVFGFGEGATPWWRDSSLAFWLLVTGVLPTAGSYALYTSGLQWLPAGRASILATVEPVVGAVLGWWIFGEALSAVQVVGGGCILGAVVLLQRTTDEPPS